MGKLVPPHGSKELKPLLLEGEEQPIWPLPMTLSPRKALADPIEVGEEV